MTEKGQISQKSPSQASNNEGETCICKVKVVGV
jgi:hypothetical protein